MKSRMPAELERMLVPLPEAAAMLSLSPRKLWSMTQAGKVPTVRFGKSVRYPVTALRRLIEQNLTTSTATDAE